MAAHAADSQKARCLLPVVLVITAAETETVGNTRQPES